jgi:hypothetical protein
MAYYREAFIPEQNSSAQEAKSCLDAPFMTTYMYSHTEINMICVAADKRRGQTVTERQKASNTPNLRHHPEEGTY